MIQTIETYEDGVLVETREVEVPDPPAADPDVTVLAAALAGLPADTLAALRSALGIGS